MSAERFDILHARKGKDGRTGGLYGWRSNRYTTLAERFAPRLIPEPNSGCWLWTGATDELGYGKLMYRRRKLRVHRVSYELHYGSIPDGLLVCHRCDTRLCANPEHLFLGTIKDNMDDKIKKGRQNAPSKISDRQATWALNCGLSAIAAAEKLGVSPRLIRAIRNGETRKHLRKENV